MIRTTRKILRALVGQKLLDDETLTTTLCEVEKIINDRPLVKASNDPNEMEALTPSSLLLLRQNSSVSPLTEREERLKRLQPLSGSAGLPSTCRVCTNDRNGCVLKETSVLVI